MIERLVKAFWEDLCHLQVFYQGGDYLLALKGNQSKLAKAVEKVFTQADEADYEGYSVDYHETKERGHGRTEVRRYWTLPSAQVVGAKKWAGLNMIGVAESQHTVNGETTTDWRYYIGSIKPEVCVFAKAVRGHWGIENGLHWVLDVAFREDDSRVRTGHAPENLALLRHIAVNVVKQEKTANLHISPL